MSATETVGVTTLATRYALAPGPPGQPDISYAPDWDKYAARTARRLKAGGLEAVVPDGFPTELKGDFVWEGDKLHETYDWTYEFNEEQLAEIDDALKHFQSLGVSVGHVSQETFPLPTLHAVLRGLSRELHFGHGFFVLRGVDVDRYTREENYIIYAGVSSHVAAVRGRQDSKYGGRPADVMLGHIRNMTGAAGSEGGIGSPAYTTDRQVFHTDSGHIVSLFALSTAAEGGASKLASSWRVYNELAKTRPDLVHTLSKNWDAELFGNTNKVHPRPILFHQPATETAPERILLQYARRQFVGFGDLPRGADLPPISEAQAEALDALHFLGERFCVSTGFQKGDMQYVNNVAVFHARDGFRDTPEQWRHLVRLWLLDPENSWEVPSELKERWDAIYEGITPEGQVFPAEPYVRSASSGVPAAK